MDEQNRPKAGPGRSVGTKMARGAAWMVILQSADRILGFVSMLVLARLLVPADFGLVALGMAIVGSLTAFSELGFDLALIQNQSAERRHYDTAWTLSIFRGLAIAALLIAVSKWNAELMGDDRLELLVYMLALVPFIEAFSNIGIVDFRKSLNFRKEFLYRLSSRLGGVLMTVTLALLWRDYWALVVGQITASTLRFTLSYVLHPYRPRFSLAAWKDLFHFSKWLFLNGLAQFASRRSATFVVGLFMTPTAVGLFALSGEIMNSISMAFIAPVQRTFFPGLAKISHDTAAVRDVLMKAYGVTVMLSVPLVVGLGLTADYFVPLVFGHKWVATIPVIQVLVFSSLANALQAPVRPLLLAIKRPELVTMLSVANAIIQIPALVIGTWLADIEGAAWALVVENSIMVLIQHTLLRRFLEISLGHVLKRIWRSIAACCLMSLAVWWAEIAVNAGESAGTTEEVADLAIMVALGALTYGIGLLTLWALSGRPEDSPEGVVVAVARKKFFPAQRRTAAPVTGGEKSGI